GILGISAIVDLDGGAPEPGCFCHKGSPACEGHAWIVVIEVSEGGVARCRVESARRRIGCGRRPQIKSTLVLCDVGIAFLHDVITPGKIVVEFAARAGCARNHEPAVPVVGEANQDTCLTLRVLGDASVDLNARYRPGAGRAMGRMGGNRVAVGVWRKRKRRQCRNRVVGGGRREIGGGEIGVTSPTRWARCSALRGLAPPSSYMSAGRRQRQLPRQ